jgi:hypothetical protein
MKKILVTTKLEVYPNPESFHLTRLKTALRKGEITEETWVAACRSGKYKVKPKILKQELFIV